MGGGVRRGPSHSRVECHITQGGTRGNEEAVLNRHQWNCSNGEAHSVWGN